MATVPVLPQVSVEEYERTADLFNRYEYVHGELVEKVVPTWKHSQLQLWIGALLMRATPQLAVGSELHARLSGTNWRIPDLAVQSREISAKEKYAQSALLLAIEIRSPEDRWSDLFAKFEDYHAWGVPFCWLFDPENERAWTFHRDGDLYEVTTHTEIRAGEIELSLPEVFSVLHNR